MVKCRGWGSKWQVGAVAALSAIVVVVELLWPRHLVDLRVRSEIETAITLSALIAAGLLAATFHRHRRLRDLLLLGALVAVSLGDFLFSALPTLAGVHTFQLGQGTSAQLAWQSLMAATFLAAAIAPRHARLRGTRRPLLVAATIAVGGVALVSLLAAAGQTHGAPARPLTGLEEATAHAVPLAFALACSSALLVAAFRFVAGAPEDRVAALLGAAAVSLATVRLQYLALPAIRPEWITPVDGVRGLAYALLLLAALTEWARDRRADELRAISAERQRIARDLHDGLAQDLAFIAVHGQRFAAELGPEHPLSVAAGRALAAARGTIVDLSASEAPSTEAALRRVAEELEARYDVRVALQIDLNAYRLEGHDREHIVRIVREAMVNAVRHGRARHVSVALAETRTHGIRLTVTDDGSGIDATLAGKAEGFGLVAMQARAQSLGGALVTRRASAGGTELELIA